jgi:colicin import membrane protein
MVKFKRHLPMSATIAIAVHVVVILFLVIGFQFKSDKKTNPLDNINTINATVISSETLDAEKKPPKQNDLQKRLAEEKKQLQSELEAEKKKAKEAKKKAEAEQQKAEEAKKLAEQKKAEEAKKLAEQKKAEEKKKLAEQKKAEEKKRKDAEKLAAEKAAEQERLAKILEAEEAEINAAEAEAQRVAKARAMSREIAIYRDAIRSRIQSRWRKPISKQPDAWCKVYVRQAPGGYVEDVVVEQCTGDEAFRRSVEEAVWKSDPLPEPPIPELFDRDLRFKFIPEI